MRPSQSICSGTATSCLAVKANARMAIPAVLRRVQTMACQTTGNDSADHAPHTHSSRGCIPNRAAPVLFDPVSVVSVRAPRFSLQVSPSVASSGL